MKQQPYAIIALMIPLALAGCNQVKMESAWSNDEIVIDGVLDEWNEGLLMPPDEAVALALRNDDEHLYIALRTADPELMLQVVNTGFTLWIDPDGGKKQVLGIGYPLQGLRNRGEQQPPDREVAPENMMEMLQQQLRGQQELLLTDEQGRVSRMGLKNPTGITAAILLVDGRLQYEARTPFTGDWENHPLAIAASPGDKIGVGLTTPEVERARPARRYSGMGGRGGGMGGGRGGGKGGGSGGSMGGPEGRAAVDTPPDPLKVWLKVETVTE